MMEFHFVRPYLLMSLAVLLPATALFWHMGFKLRQKTRKAYGEEKLVARFSQPLRMAAEATLLAAWLGAIAMLVVSAAGPSVPDAPQSVQEGSLQVVVLSDVSKSMAAEDYRPYMPNKNGLTPDTVPGSYGTRLDMAKLVVMNDIMPSIMGNELGIATYCGEGFDQADLTTDYKSLRWIMMHWMKVGAAPGGGSDYAEGLKEALIIFQNTPAPNKQKVIVWFTDGGFTGDQQELNKVIDQVQQAGIKVVIVGVGSDSPQPIPVYSPSGQVTGFMQKDGAVVTTRIDEGALNTLSTRMGAQYIRLIPGQKLDIQWASTLAGGHTEKHETQVFQYPLGLAAVLLFGLFVRGILPANRRRGA